MAKYRRIELNPIKTQQIYDYFYSREELIGVCRDFKNSLVFKGGIDLDFGGGLFSSKGMKDPDEQRRTIDLLQRALDYKDMYGMCPFEVKPDPVTLLPKIIIPESGFGKFVLLVSKHKLQTKVKYELSGKKRSLQVFVWPGLDPSLNGEFKSKVFKLYATYVELREYQANALDADFELTHPPLVTQHRTQDFDITKISESEMYGDADPDQLNPEEKSMYRRNVLRGKFLEAQVDLMRNPTQSATPIKGAKDGLRYDSTQGKILHYQRGDLLKDRIYQLDTGEEISKQITPVINNNRLNEFHLAYQYMVCLVFGIPRDYLMSASGVLKNTAVKEREIIQTRVEDDRRGAEIFYQFVYDSIYRKEDDNHLINVLHKLDQKKRGLATQDKQRLVIKGAKRKIKDIGASKNRIRLKFLEDPFKDTIDANSILIGADRGYITRKEEVLLYRAHLGLPEISINILDKDKKEREQQKLESEEKMQQIHQNGNQDSQKEKEQGEEPPKKKRKKDLSE